MNSPLSSHNQTTLTSPTTERLLPFYFRSKMSPGAGPIVARRSSANHVLASPGRRRHEAASEPELHASINRNDPISKWISLLAVDHRHDDRGEVYCYDIDRATKDQKHPHLQLLHHLGSQEPRETQFDVLRDFWEGKNANCHSRLIVVEDISDSLIQLLDSALGLDPMVLIQHLKGSGVNDDSLDRLAANDCVEAFLGNQVLSSQWYRPVNRLSQDNRHHAKRVFSFPLETWPEVDLDREKPGLRVRRLERPLVRESSDMIDTNIFRDSWQIGAQVVEADRDRISVPAAWEEKVTIHREFRDGIEFSKSQTYLILLNSPKLFTCVLLLSTLLCSSGHLDGSATDVEEDGGKENRSESAI